MFLLTAIFLHCHIGRHVGITGLHKCRFVLLSISTFNLRSNKLTTLVYIPPNSNMSILFCFSLKLKFL